MGNNIFKINEWAGKVKMIGLLITGICWLLMFLSVQPVKRIEPRPVAPGKKINALPSEKNDNELACQYEKFN